MTRTKKRLAIILTALIVFMSTVIGVVIIKATRKTTTVSATSVATTYTNPLPDGAYIGEYTTLDLAKEYGTDKVLSIAHSGSEKGFSYALNGATAYRFKMSRSGSAWAIRLGIFNDNNENYILPNNDSAYIALRNDQPFDVIPNNNTHNVSMKYPTWYNIANENVYEFAGVKVYDASGSYIGRLFYLDINEARVAEYFYSSSDESKFANDNLTINIVCSATQSCTLNITSPETVDLTNRAIVEFDAETYSTFDKAVTPEPTLYKSIEIEGNTYVSLIDKQQYDVAYTDNDKSGTATATVTFKGKYSGTVTGSFKVVAPFADYTDPIPKGFYLDNEYTVKELSNFTYNTAGGNTTNALDGADAVRFTLWYGNAATYMNGLTKITLFGKNYYSTDANAGMITFDIQKSADIGEMGFTINQTNNNTVKETKTYPQPEWIDLTTKQAYAFDIGGIDVFDDNNNYAGKFFYVDVNGVRIMEYFYSNSDLKFSNDNCCFWSACTSASVTSYKLTETNAVDLGTETKVNIAKSTSGDKVEITPIVYAARSTNGSTYVQRVEDKYYEVTYTDNDKTGTATANITFNGKYAGTASVDYEIVGVQLTSDSAATQTVYALKGASVALGELEVDGKVFIGYDVDGVLSRTATVVAEENATAKFVAIDFATSTEVALRKNGSAKNKVGMRFLSTVSTADLELLKEYGAEVSFGTLITSPDKSGKLDIKTVNWMQNEELAVEGCDTFTAVVTGFNTNLYSTRFTARAYAEITLGGETFTVWATVASEYSCSFAKLCADAIAAGEVTEADTYYAYFQEAANAYVAE